MVFSAPFSNPTKIDHARPVISLTTTTKSTQGSASSSDSDLENVYGRLQQLSKSFEGALNLSELDEQLEDLDSPLFNDDPSDDDSADREFNLVVYGNELKSANRYGCCYV